MGEKWIFYMQSNEANASGIECVWEGKLKPQVYQAQQNSGKWHEAEQERRDENRTEQNKV